jgi:hypothetical protein
MTERKPARVSFESRVKREIAEAVRRGDFDDIPGAGKPCTYDQMTAKSAKPVQDAPAACVRIPSSGDRAGDIVVQKRGISTERYRRHRPERCREHMGSTRPHEPALNCSRRHPPAPNAQP